MPAVPFSVEWTRVRTIKIILDKGNGCQGRFGVGMNVFRRGARSDGLAWASNERGGGFDGSVVAWGLRKGGTGVPHSTLIVQWMRRRMMDEAWMGRDGGDILLRGSELRREFGPGGATFHSGGPSNFCSCATMGCGSENVYVW
jgi:hypothetical protein